MNPSRPLAVLALLLLGGCAVGPDFVPPAAPDVHDYTPHPITTTVAGAKVVGGEAQRLNRGEDLPADWWTLFHSTALNALIEQSLAHNPDLKAAQAALTMAREDTLAGRGAYYPSVIVAGMLSRLVIGMFLMPTLYALVARRGDRLQV